MPAPVPAPESALALALSYAASGLRVLPIKPGTKRPPMREWVEAATTNLDIITSWFTEPLYRDHGVGLAMGRQPDGRLIFALDVDEHDVAHSGVTTLSDLQAEHGVLPDTVCSITGAGGLHLLYEAPNDIEVRNGIAGDGLDVRGEGGQIVVSPSIHPVTHRRYEWEDTFAPWERAIAIAPEWLTEIVRLTSTPVTQPASALPASTFDFADPDPDSPAEWLRVKWDWALQLHDAGWDEHHVNRQTGAIHWTRPGKPRREGESAVLHVGGPLVVFSTDASLTGLRQVARHVNRDGSVSVTPMEFYAAYRHGGNLSLAARAINAMRNPTDTRLSAAGPPEEGPLDRYLGQELDWATFWRNDHSGEDWVAEPLIPAGRLVALYAPAKQGKSEVAFAVVVAMATGRPILGQRNPWGPRHVIYLDYEMTKSDLWERLELLGYDENVDLSHLHYYSLPSLPPLDTAEGCAVLRGMAKERHAEAVVIDTMGRAVEGDENSNDTYRAFARFTGLGLKADGVAVVRTDHAGKDRDKGQRGASAKNDDADVVFRVERVDGGWKLQRTHTRVSWVPESVSINRIELADGTLKIELAPASTPTYPTGTGTYVADLKAAGITVDQSTTVRQLTAMAKAAHPPMSRSTKMMTAALKWLQLELPKYTTGPTPISPGGVPAPLTHSEPDQGATGHTEGLEPADSHLSGDETPKLGDIT